MSQLPVSLHWSQFISSPYHTHTFILPIINRSQLYIYLSLIPCFSPSPPLLPLCLCSWSQMFPWLDNADWTGPPEMTKVRVCWGQHFAETPGNILKTGQDLRADRNGQRQSRMRLPDVFLWHTALWLTFGLTSEDDVTGSWVFCKEFIFWPNMKQWLRERNVADLHHVIHYTVN